MFLLVVTGSQSLAQERGLKPASAPVAQDSLLGYATRYALVIGVNRYQDKNISDLQYAVDDAATIRDILVHRYGYEEDNVVFLHDLFATRESIMSSLSHYIGDEIEENSQLLVYFAGHGTTIGDQNAQLGYLLPHDARIGSVQDIYSTGIAMDEIRRISQTLRPKHVLFLMDACYGGLASTRSTLSQVFMRNALERKARQIITAGSAEEEVIESAKWKHSAFTKVLIDALDEGYADGNEDGIIAAVELFSYIENRVPYYAASEGGKQTPQYSKLTPDDGTFLFISDEEALQALQNDNASILELDVDIIRKQFTTPITISANVDNARVYLDDKEIGYLSQREFNYDLSPGFYRIELRKEKYSNEVQEVEVMPDTTVTTSFDLEYTYSQVAFNVQPIDAAVYVNDEFIGSGSFTKELPKGRNKIVVTKEGYRPEILNTNLTLDLVPIEVSLDRIESRLELYTVPSGALILMNGDTLGTSPVRVPLGYGTHSLYIQKEDYRDELFPLEVTESELISRTIKLRESPETLARRTYRKRLFAYGRNAVALAGVAAGGYYFAYPAFDEANKQASDDDEYKPLYFGGKWLSLVLAGWSAIKGTQYLVRIGTMRYSEILNEQLEREAAPPLSLHVVPTYDGNQGGVTAVLTF